ncbi:hypothetical protein RRG08_046140 [Elysia crispata]|uniref:G-protein coupled receptors family 1 profile domain-containing protein n=1 Tax=Elysia crispata TaxID=231223 RepID=A0AAE1A369_9GAST|nr:hypothetical protein RRG08_046140 [Elysia crispata]
MTTKLYEATRVRSSHTRPNPTKDTGGEKILDGTRMSAKDIQVIQSVVLVCIIFILSQLPFILYSTARFIEPEFSDKGRYVFLFRLCTTVSLTCSFLNASVNIFVYYTYNTKYRTAFLSIFCADDSGERQ